MRSTFPLTDYDFYAYVLTGVVALGVVDHAIFDGAYIIRWKHWSFQYGAAIVALSYIAGQLVSMVSGLLLEQLLLCRVLCPPREYLLRVKVPSRWARWTAKLSGSHYTEALPESVADLAIGNAARALGHKVHEFRALADRSEQAFQYGYAVGRLSEDGCRRIDRDRREYEVSRNLCLVCLVSGPLLLMGPEQPSRSMLAGTALAVGAVMLIRFIRYFVSYHVQVLRAAAFARFGRDR